MRLAVVSDVHGNLPALEAVIADLSTQKIDQVVDLGDLVSGAVQPRETADLLMELDWPTVSGNHERQVLTVPLEQMSASDRLAYQAITDQHRTWLGELPLTLEMGQGVLAFHGSPSGDRVYLLETVEPTGARPATVEEVVERLGEYADRPLLLCGHTHLQRTMRLPGGGLVVNPGSVGHPAYAGSYPHPHAMEAGTPHARYAVVDDSTGQWQAQMVQVSYDWEFAARTAETNDRPEIARALRTGRV